MTRKILSRSLILLGIINALTIIIGALTGPNAYTIANNLHNYFKYLLCFIPLFLASFAFAWWIVDRSQKSKSETNYIAIAFFGIFADAVFVIGTILFASGH